ncbi:MAG: bis(5'-nucleosyl)-tetraphosphatase (symmetrical) YqeK [Clostridiales bacterium]|nr:bis(5'-nucleosyl)-tetraphosphatase (symmetrical) YqeK [Clostridiales bacterium]
MKYKEIQKDLQNLLKPSRYEHTMGVVETAVHLANRYGCDEKKAKYAALLHDCAKHLSDSEKIEMCRTRQLPVTEVEMANPSLLHAKCGSVLASERYGVSDEEILHAIRVHTTGVPNMGLLDLIIFVSDYIEPGRDMAPHLNELRKLADKNLTRTAYLILRDTIEYLNSREEACMDPMTQKAYEYYKTLCGNLIYQ